MQSGTLSARCAGAQGPGGLITIQSDLSLTSSATVDASGGIAGGEVDIDAGSAITLNGLVDVSGRATASAGGTVIASAAADPTAIVRVLVQPPSASCPLADFNQDDLVDETDLDLTILLEFLALEP